MSIGKELTNQFKQKIYTIKISLILPRTINLQKNYLNKLNSNKKVKPKRSEKMLKQRFSKIKKTLPILLTLFFLATLTVSSASASPSDPKWDAHSHYWLIDGHQMRYDGHYWWDDTHHMKWDGYHWWNNNQWCDGHNWRY